MKPEEFQHLMRIAVLERARAIAAAEQRYRETVESIRKVQSLYAQRDSTILPDARPLRHGDVASRVKLAIGQVPDVFMLSDLVQAVRAQDVTGSTIKSTVISSVAQRLVGQQIEVIERGQGKRGSKYRKLVPKEALSLNG